MATSVGLDINARSVRAVELGGSRTSYRVLRYLERGLTPRGDAPDPEELRAALQEIFRGEKFPRHNVVCSVEANDTVVREIPVPFKSDDQIRKVVKYEAEHHLHDCDADDVIVQYAKVGESKEGTNLLVFAARKEEIGRRIDYARGAGVEPLAMDLDAVAFFNSVRAAGLLADAPACVLLHVSHRATEMIFVESGEIRALRSVRLGVDSIVQGLARDMDIDFAEADNRFQAFTGGEESGDLFIPADGGGRPDRKDTEKSHAELERDLFSQKRDEFAARLKREYVRSSAALRGTAKPEKILVGGCALQVAGLVDLLGARLGLAAESFRPSQVFATKLNGTSTAEFDAGGAVAMGLALKGLGADEIHLDFRQEEWKVANKFELLKGALAITQTILFLGLLAASFHYLKKKDSLSSQRFDPMLTKAFRTIDEAAKLYNQVNPRGEVVDLVAVESAGPKPEALRRFVDRLRAMRSALLRDYGGGQGVTPIESALKTWNEIFSVIGKHHKEIVYIDFQRVQIQQDSVRLGMVISSTNAAETLGRLLSEQVGALKEMDLQPVSTRPFEGTDHQLTTLVWQKRRGR